MKKSSNGDINKKDALLNWILGIYLDIIDRSSRPEVFYKKVSLEIS